MTDDHGSQPYVVNIEELTKQNENFRTAVWTGQFLQTTVMSIEVGGEIGLEVHHDTDQFLRIEQGKARVIMGNSEEDMEFEAVVGDDFAVFIPSGKWHNVINIGDETLKLYSIYAPSHHPFGTVHMTKTDSDDAEKMLEHNEDRS